MRKSGPAIFSLALAVLLATPSVFARNIYLNGVDIATVRNQTFKNVKAVFIDDNGDVHMTAPGYNVEVVDENHDSASPVASTQESTEGGANALLRSRYFMATRPSKNGAAQYDFLIKINGVERKLIKAGSPVIIMEISAWFHKGENKVEIIAKKNLAVPRISTAPSDISEVLIGAGHEEGSIVKVDVVHGSIKASASQITDITKRFTVNAI